MSNKINIGMRFNSLLVIDTVETPKHLKQKLKHFLCKCDCGNTKIICGRNITSGHTKSCGCLFKNNLINLKFGRLLVLEKSMKIAKNGDSYVDCVCDCGIKITVKGYNLKKGLTKSCGCFKIEQTREKFSLNNVKDAKLSSALSRYKGGYSGDEMTFDIFYYLSQQNCFYCDASIEISRNKINKFKTANHASLFSIEHGDFIYNGIDRINNNNSYKIENIVPCCSTCNKFKKNLSISEFIKNINNLLYVPKQIFSDKIFNIINLINKNNYKKYSELLNLKQPNGRYKYASKLHRIKSSAKKRKLILELSDLQIIELFCSNCCYCERISDYMNGKFNGLDRVDNNIGYTIKNSVSCCKYCNVAKNNMSLDEFICWIRKIKDYFPTFKEKIKNDKRFKI